MVRTIGSSPPAPIKRARRGVRPIYVFAVAIILLIASAFIYLSIAKTGEKQEAACVLVIDRTGSSTSEQTRASYRALAESTIAGCKHDRASINILFFDNQNAKLQRAGAPKPISLWLPEKHVKKLSEAEQKKNLEDAEKNLDVAFGGSLQASTGGHLSDIVTAVHAATPILQNAARRADVHRKYLVVLTDGYQSGDTLSMKYAFTAPTSSPRALVQRTAELDLIPQLEGVQVSFVGVGGGVATRHEQVPAWYDALVRRYWKSVVARGGGRTCIYDIEADSLPASC